MLGLRRLRHERPVAERAAPRRAEAPQERLAPALTATAACVLARPGPRQPGESELDLPWLEIADEALVAVPARQPVPGPQVLTFPWAIR